MRLSLRIVRRAARILRFIGYFAVQLVQANLVVVREILTPGSGLCPAIVRIPLQARTDHEIVWMVLCVGLTPGTLPLAIDRSAPALYVHGMHARDLADFSRRLAALEGRLLSAMRPAATTREPVGPAGPTADTDRG
ncbi:MULTISPECIES: Na+/H+ antiporter subunit E [Micromonospora]|uniref:Cation transporter n=2 Tax=Micromonosporaceae TaxID=28056 RepID=A0ABX9WAJ1_9ACTN|nr:MULTISPECIES: Na+/H+ antiporter subunit E [Micromonospora]NES12810.1 Na+/H+ antiporter subunit E [Micromonospora sp. PPF5-17B]NES38916.1 Na+/H+ antiporter subunit E [Micromonospora solifontis]NES54735.1 Na+/H+ antiporter subunit E [Micromonospora sp. PPF5-6]RNL92578.1 cation transporter [Micromonospora solifontis]